MVAVPVAGPFANIVIPCPRCRESEGLMQIQDLDRSGLTLKKSGRYCVDVVLQFAQPVFQGIEFIAQADELVVHHSRDGQQSFPGIFAALA